MKCINPSLICFDHLNLRRDIQEIHNHGISKIHVDVMDGNFVNRFGLYPEIVRDIALTQEFEFDLHFMVDDPLGALEEWKKYIIPAKVSFHYSSNREDYVEVATFILETGIKPIVAIDFDVTKTEIIEIATTQPVKGVLLMGIQAGLLIQEHQPDRVIEVLEILQELDLPKDFIIQVDGAVNFKTIPRFMTNGATELICGSSSLFNKVRKPDGSTDKQKLKENKEIIEHIVGQNV